MKNLLKGKKVVDGNIKKIYAKGLTKSEYVVAVRDKAKARKRDHQWREENREYYNNYMRDYMRRRAKQKKLYGR